MSDAWASAASALMSANAAAVAQQQQKQQVQQQQQQIRQQQIQQQQQQIHQQQQQIHQQQQQVQQQQQLYNDFVQPQLPPQPTAVNVYDLSMDQLRNVVSALVQEHPNVGNELIGRALGGGITPYAYVDASAALRQHPEPQRPSQDVVVGANSEHDELAQARDNLLQQQMGQQNPQPIDALQPTPPEADKAAEGVGGGPKKRKSTPSSSRGRKRSRGPATSTPPTEPPILVEGATPTSTSDANSNSNSTRKTSTWMQRLEELRLFREEHGHCRVPTVYKPNPPLGRWCDNQRQAHRRYVKEGPEASWLNADRIRQLEDVGFEWSVAAYTFKDWDVWYRELIEYRDKHGHTRVPMSGDTVRLGGWVSKIRSDFVKRAEGKVNPLTQERVDKLNEIGFEWRVRDPTVEWSDRVKELKAFHAKHGHFNVPKHVNNKDHPDHGLGMWLYYQRVLYKKRKLGEKSPLTDERIATLSLIGFDWEGKLVLDRKEWDSRFDELRAYTEKFGTCHVKANTKGDDTYKHLSKWYRRQNEQYRKHLVGEKTTLTPERLEKLNALGFHQAVMGPRKGRHSGGSMGSAEKAEREQKIAAEKAKKEASAAAARARRLSKHKNKERQKKTLKEEKPRKKGQSADEDIGTGQENEGGVISKVKSRRRGRPRKVT